MSEIDTESIVGSEYSLDAIRSPSSVSTTGTIMAPKEKKRTKRSFQSMDADDVMEKFFANRPKPSDFFPPEKPSDDIDAFFHSIATTVRKFSPVAVARLKLRIANMVGEEEISWAEAEASNRVQYIIVEPPAKRVAMESSTQESAAEKAAEEMAHQLNKSVEIIEN